MISIWNRFEVNLTSSHDDMGNGIGRVSPGVTVGHVIGHYERDFSVELSDDGPLGVKPNWIILDPYTYSY